MNKKETRIYEVTGYPAQLDILEKVFGRIQFFGSVGMSRKISIYVDGDGSVRLKFTKNGEKLNHNDGTIGCGYFKTLESGDVKVNLG